jgi:hypothetical protein
MKITPQRLLEIETEARRRINLWMLHSTFNEMTVYGSLMRFCMSVGLLGYPFEKETWMEGFDKFITDDEYDSVDYDNLMLSLYNEQQTINNKNN